MLSDSAADWKLALALLQHRGNPLQAISWAQVVSALTAGLDQMLTAATQPCRGCGSNPLNGKR
eukprot:XP_001692156.1 predicted protein [Chlamydomonas reinhardtii]